MPIIDLVDLENAPDEVRQAADAHLARGYSMTNEKRTLLHNVQSFEALEGMSYAVSAELQRFVTPRAAGLFEYAISLENECFVCSTYYRHAMQKYGITNLEDVDYTEDEALLIEYARAIVKDRKNIPEELFERLKAHLGQEGLVVLTTMAVFMVANNYFNDILKVRSEFLSFSPSN